MISTLLRDWPNTMVGTWARTRSAAEHHGLLHVARADAELGVHDRRVVEEEAPRPLRSAALVEVTSRSRAAEEARGVLARVADGGRGADEHGARAVERRDAEKSPDHVGDVRAEDALVGVQLVDRR
jgi:hypothetical protein